MEAYSVMRDLAIIIIVAKVFGLVARKLKAPQVLGEIIAGLVIGPCCLGLVGQTDFILQMAEVGVVLLMFSAGLETNFKVMIKTGPVALLIASLGVLVPLIGGTLVYMAFHGFSAVGTDEFYTAIFMGVILTATSVSITVQVLKELGKLKGKVGTSILSAAIIDDVIGIIILTVVIGFKDPSISPTKVLINTALFFLFAAVVGVISYKIFAIVDKRYPHTRRIPIAGLAYCLAFAFIAEHYFGIADITGAYLAGIILCNISDAEYIAEKMDINSYMLFGPIFFASIGLKTTISGINGELILFTIALVVVALLTKVVGCGLAAKLCKFNWNDSLKVGVGMMNRGEVALIVGQKGLAAGLLAPIYFTSVIILIIVSAILSPIMIKLLYRNDTAEEDCIE